MQMEMRSSYRDLQTSNAIFNRTKQHKKEREKEKSDADENEKLTSSLADP